MHTQTMNWFCATRALKNAKYLQKAAPNILPEREPKDGFESIIPLKILDRLHQNHALDGIHKYAHLAKLLKGVTFPAIRTQVSAPLFSGTLYFVQMEFTIQDQGNKVISLSDSDMATILNYANLATLPISEYAAQYGPNSITVHQSPLSFAVTLPSTTYNDTQLQEWVFSIGLQYGLPSNTGIVVPNPPGVVNTDGAPSNGVGGYHSRVGLTGLSYAFANVRTQNLTLEDSSWSYAAHVSHEIAEMVVDPRVDHSNPEVCDPCGPNCASYYLAYFDNCSNYIATVQAFPPPFPYSFFINGIVQPAYALPCPITVPSSACTYAPPLINGPISLSSPPGVDADQIDGFYEVNLNGAPLTSIQWEGENGVSIIHPTEIGTSIDFDMSNLSFEESKTYTISVRVVTEGNCSITGEIQVSVHKIPCHPGQDSCGGTGG